MVTKALLVRLEVKPGFEDKVEEFLRDAEKLVEEEPGTVAWFAIRFGPSTFGVFDALGDAGGLPPHEQGLYHHGTRHLSTFELRLAGHRLLLLSSTLQDHSDVLTVDLTNPDIQAGEDAVWPKGLLHVHRTRFLWQATCHERIVVSNFGLSPVGIALDVTAGADFADIFEVRGTTRAQRGQMLPPRVTDTGLVFGYIGLDDVERQTVVDCDPAPEHRDGRLRFVLQLEPRSQGHIVIAVRCGASARPRPPVAWDTALAQVIEETADAVDVLALALHSSSTAERDQHLRRAREDLAAVATVLHPARLNVKRLEGEGLVVLYRPLIVDLLEATGLSHEDAAGYLPKL